MLEDGGGEAYTPAGETLIPKHIVGRKNDHTLYQRSEGSAPNGDVMENSVGRPGKPLRGEDPRAENQTASREDGRQATAAGAHEGQGGEATG